VKSETLWRDEVARLHRSQLTLQKRWQADPAAVQTDDSDSLSFHAIEGLLKNLEIGSVADFFTSAFVSMRGFSLRRKIVELPLR
jgi:hypothetical protein